MTFPRAILIALASYLFLAWRLIVPLHLSLVPSLTAALALSALVAAMFLYPMSWWRGGRLRRLARRPKARRLSHLALAFGSILFTVVLVRDALWLTVGWFLPDSIALERWSSVAAVALALLMFAWGLIQVRMGPRLKRVRVSIPGLPSALSGFRIVQLSDIHIGESVRREQIEKVVGRVNQLDADLIAITGDLVDGSVAQLERHVEPLSRLLSKSGTFFVPGNHEHYSGIREWLIHLDEIGFIVLRNAHRVVTRGEHALVMAGVDDLSATSDPRGDVQRSLRGSREDAVRILLAHHPMTALAASKERIALQLSGHTHGGQFLPWNFLAPFVHRFNAGLYRVEDMWLYVSRGTFYWGPPFRLMAPAEITIIELFDALDE